MLSGKNSPSVASINQGSYGPLKAACAPRPQMVRAELLGAHEHETSCGKTVQVWKRGNSFLIRGRYEGRQFGQTVGDNPTIAASQLRHILIVGEWKLPASK